MKQIKVLLKKNIKSISKKRFFIILGFLLLFQSWFILTSDTVAQVEKSGEMFYMAVVFSFNFFGAIAALALNYDAISNERETKYLDLLLTSGVSKKKVYLCKVLTCFIVSFAFSLLYIAALMLLYFAVSGRVGLSLMVLNYLFPIAGFMSVFTLMGLTLSIVFRSSKTALIVSIIIGAFLMPRLFVSIADGLGNALGLKQSIVEIVYLLSPAMILNSLASYADKTQFIAAVVALALFIISIVIIGVRAFILQDELNYGE